MKSKAGEQPAVKREDYRRKRGERVSRPIHGSFIRRFRPRPEIRLLLAKREGGDAGTTTVSGKAVKRVV